MAHADVAPAGPVVAPHARRELTALMGCRASVTVVGPEDPTTTHRMLTVAEWRLRDLEARWSRFLPDSEVSLLGRGDGRPVAVSVPTRDLVRHLVEAWDATEGAFDPTLLPSLVARGYRASVVDPECVTELPRGALARFDPSLIEVDDDAGTVRLPRGGTLDAGGLGKGLAADLVTAELLDRGATGAMVEIGGDLRVSGTSPWGPDWRIEVEDPLGGTPLAVVGLVDGGVATSSVAHRRWSSGSGHEHHHLIDPRTSEPAATDVVAATAVTATGAWSEAFAKVAFARDLDGAVRLLDDDGVAAMIVLADRTTVTTARWADVVVDR